MTGAAQQTMEAVRDTASAGNVAAVLAGASASVSISLLSQPDGDTVVIVATVAVAKMADLGAALRIVSQAASTPEFLASAPVLATGGARGTPPA